MEKCQGTSVISPVIPLLAVVLSAFIISQKSVDKVFETYPSLYIITFGMVAAKVTNKLVVSARIYSTQLTVRQINKTAILYCSFADCTYDKEWNGIHGLRSYWAIVIVFKSIFQQFLARNLCVIHCTDLVYIWSFSLLLSSTYKKSI